MSDSEEQKRKGLYDLGFTLEDPLESIYSNYDFSLPEDFNLDVGSLGANPDFGLNFDWDSISNFMADPQLFAAFAELNPEHAATLKDMMGGDYGFAPVGGGSPVDAASGVYDPNDQSAAETARLQRQANATPEGDETGIKSGVPVGGGDTSGIKSFLDKAKQTIKDVTGLDAGDAAKYAAMLAAAKLAYDDAERARKEAKGWTAPSTGGYTATRGPKGTSFRKAASGGVMSLGMAKGRYLGGMTDGMADKVPAHIDNKRPAALSDGEFVIPADVVSHLGNGNSNAGAKRLYEMMDDIRAARTGNPKQGKQINPDKFMPR